ncbi:hypothetical protein WOLCODRAFT_71275 [Wolfiporia cocos MD-104 SS10]|uniref:XRRM domain-containing protein n=1 Tax=Wolfiporia cocos (strain MD-104) TaxID=742152 RepID=A0A2H3JEW2_WOLCO|nr:hypothetical protein WOLCODRAFT_71275 [Wolfiporia cocos MD-104 SS10]
MFLFVPRKVAQKTKAPLTLTNTPPSPTGQTHVSNPPSAASIKASEDTDNVTISEPPASSSLPQDRGKRPDTGLTDEDYSVLVCLSLSDHAQWSDADLRRTIASGDEGYIPLRYLLRHSPALSTLSPTPPESVIAKAIRSHANAHLEVRMRVVDPAQPGASAYGGHTASAGGFDVRRREWKAALHRARNGNRQEWEERTVYVENVPPQYRSVPVIARFSTSLLEGSSACAYDPQRVQGVWLPPHHRDQPGDTPKCKGFALVTLAGTEDCQYLMERWPWTRTHTANSHSDVNQRAGVGDAIKYGFRTMSKTRWEQLKEEYLTYRQRLLDSIACAAVDDADEEAKPPELEPCDHVEDASASVTEAIAGNTHTPPERPIPSTPLNLSYPQGCLVFVRNVHPETNKTTLRTLFSQAFADASARVSKDGLDYVDFNKGMDTCYLRLATPQHTRLLDTFFHSNPVVQTQGLDSSGAPHQPSGKDTTKPIAMEVVGGTREELYWNKVPEKVRRQAVERAAAMPHADSGDGGEDGVGVRDTPKGEEGRRARKRRRRNG